MSNKKEYLVPVGASNEWLGNKYRKVSREELDKILEIYSNDILKIISNGEQGVMTMWAYFKNRLCGGCYGDIINAYRILSNDNKSLVDREHELRHAYQRYKELWRIRYFGSVEAYHLAKAKEAKEKLENI